MEPSPDLASAIEFWGKVFSVVRILAVVVAGTFAVSFAYMGVLAAFFRAKSGSWSSQEFYAYLGVEHLYPVAIVHAVINAPVVASAPAVKPKRRKKKALPPQEPPRPKQGLRVRGFPGSLSRVRGEFYMDQDCCDRELVKLMECHGLIVLTTFQAGNMGADDGRQLEFAASQRMVIVTRDRGFIRRDAAGARHAGIIHAPHGEQWYQEILRIALRLAGEVAEK